MSDRAFQIGIGLSLALHLAAAIMLSGPRQATPIVRPPAQAASVRVRLASPPRAAAEAAKPPAVAAPPPPPPHPRERERPERVVQKLEPAQPETAPPPEPRIEQRAEPEVDAPEPVDPAAQTRLAAAQARESDEAPTEIGVPSPALAADLPDARPSDADDPSRLARYVDEVRARIEARKRYPAMARKRSVEGRVVARVEIRADGRVAAIEFDGGAPPLLRRATDEAIRSAAPYPAPPAGAMTIELPVDYALRDAS